MATADQIINRLLVMPSGCHEWDGCRDEKGYGLVNFNGKTRRVHRVIWELTSGPIPPGLHVLHKCDNPSCGRLDHLFIGTNADNQADKAKKGRAAARERNGASKLTAQQAAAIRKSSGSCKEVGRMYGVSAQSVSLIRRGLMWA